MRFSIDRTSYYPRYYYLNKNQYRERYYMNKFKTQLNEQMYEEVGGEKLYYKNYYKDKVYLMNKEQKIKYFDNLNEIGNNEK